MIGLAWRSVLMRRTAALLTAVSLAVSVALLLGVERISQAARTSFHSTLSGTDLIVGARSAPTQLLLHAAFRIGTPTEAMDPEVHEWLSRHPEVAWSIPIALGDSYRGYPVVGTSEAYFEHFRFGRNQALTFTAGGPFRQSLQLVLGAQIARRLGHSLGDAIVISHGIQAEGFFDHSGQHFTVSGILAATGTPVDRSLHIRLHDMHALHAGWDGGAPPAFGSPAQPGTAVAVQAEAEQGQLNAVLLGLRSDISLFALQREIMSRPGKPLSAILPAPTLVEIWKMVEVVNTALGVVAGMVLAAVLIAMLAMLLAGLDQRRREMAILRAVGARRRDIFALLMSEAAMLSAAGCAAGVALLFALGRLGAPWLEQRFGLLLPVDAFQVRDLGIIGVIVVCGMLAGMLPAWKAYRRSVADGLSDRL